MICPATRLVILSPIDGRAPLKAPCDGAEKVNVNRSGAKVRQCAHWRVVISPALRDEAGAPHRWIAEALGIGSPNSVRVAVWRLASK
jgi:hypothetical protein